MPKARYRQVSVESTPYYHCISRCVRRAFLCGKDSQTGYDFEHRRQWIIDRIKLLCSVFAVDLCAYAIMNNHYHIVVRINSEQVAEWSDEEVAKRWMQVFTGPVLMHQYLGNADLSHTEHKQVAKLFTTWRERLCDLSWFMRCINEPIARLANREEHCTGRFWEGRFKSQAPPILARLRMDASPVLKYLTKDDLPGFGAMGPVSMLKDFAKSVGRNFIKGHAFGDQLCPERS